VRGVDLREGSFVSCHFGDLYESSEGVFSDALFYDTVFLSI
jgi:hypothetical protein